MTDEQRMRESFEAILEGKEPEELQLTAWGTYPNMMLQVEWRLWQRAWAARDAEVQALREALSELRDMAQLCIDRKAINPISHHAEALLLAEYLDKADAALSRAALGEAADAN